MSKHVERESWWPYIKNILRKYRRLEDQYSGVTITAAAVHAARPTEQRAISMTGQHYREYEAVRKTIAYTSTLGSGDIRNSLISLTYFDRKYRTMEDAAEALHISYRTAKRYNHEFIELVASHLFPV